MIGDEDKIVYLHSKNYEEFVCFLFHFASKLEIQKQIVALERCLPFQLLSVPFGVV